MNILIAEDDAPSRLLLQSLLGKWGYSVITAADGTEAWKILCEEGHPQLMILDWMMPGIEGPEIIRRLREREPERAYYAIIITSRNHAETVTQALEVADDFIRKPFDQHELKARVAVGVRMIELQSSLLEHVAALNESLAQVKQLEGIIPICMYCKKIRDDQDSWNQLEQYISDHSQALFSHGICPDCYAVQIAALRQIKLPLE